MPPTTTPAESMPIAEPYQRPALTLRGAAALRLADFRDVWAELAPSDRVWFAEDLRDLLVEAVVPGMEPTA